MKILYLSNSSIPSQTANSIHVVKMCEAFAKQGHEVTLLAQQKQKKQEKNLNPYQFYDVKNNFDIVQVPISRLPFSFFMYLFRIVRILRKQKPDLVYGRFLEGCLLSTIFGYQTIYESHIPVWQKGIRQEKIFSKMITRKSFKYLVVISQALKTVYVKKDVLSKERILIAPDAASEVADLTMTAKLSDKPNALQVGYIGSLNEGKGIEIIAKIAPMMPDANFHIVGGGDKDITRWKERIVSKNVFFHGFIQQSHLSPIINALDVCLLPNQPVVRPHGKDTLDIGRFTSPLKLFQYMAHKKAIIASDLPIIREVLNKQNAILVPHDDPKIWISAIESLLNKNKREVIAEKA